MPITDPRPQSAVVGVVYEANRFLVIRRSQHVIAPGEYCFCGGMRNLEESSQSALKREFQEELGVQVTPLHRHWQSLTPWQIRVEWWTVALLPEQPIRLNTREVDEYRWWSAEQLRSCDSLLESNRHWLEAWKGQEFEL